MHPTWKLIISCLLREIRAERDPAIQEIAYLLHYYNVEGDYVGFQDKYFRPISWDSWMLLI